MRDQAASESIGLVSDDHAWVLPSYYNPNWWRMSNKNGSINYRYNCTDEDMQNILESVIFVDGIKIPPVVYECMSLWLTIVDSIRYNVLFFAF